MSTTPIWQSVRRILQLSGRHQAWLYAAVASDLVYTVVLVLSMHFLRRLFEAVSAQDVASLWLYMGLCAGTVVIQIPLAYFRTRSLGLFSERTLAVLRQKIAARSAVLPMGYLEERHTGDLLSIVNSDLAKLKTLTSNDLFQLVSQTTRALGALIYLIILSWQLTLVCTLMVPLMFLLISRLTQPISKRTNEMQGEIGKVNSLIQDGLSGLMVTRVFNLALIMDERLRQANLTVLKKAYNIAWLRAIIDVFTWFVAIMPFFICFAYGGYLAVVGLMTFGSVFAFINLLNFVANPLGSLPGIIASIGEATGAAQRMFQILDHEVERTDGAEFLLPKEANTLIGFKEMNFAYEKDAPVLDKVSFNIKKGETVALVGPSGGGKSTVLKLLLGFYPLEDQRVTLFGHDLNAWRLAAARRQMSFVAQDTYLFPVSIAENIALGKPGASQAEVEQAAKSANIHDFIMTLPQEYNTQVGERGARLSGGQRQRISLARAVLKDAPILLLDEATSALDSESEALVQEALDHFMVNRTTIVIAHRLSTIKNASRVLVLDGGKIVEEGTHDELFARGGLYKDLYLRQFNPEKPSQTTETGGVP